MCERKRCMWGTKFAIKNSSIQRRWAVYGRIIGYVIVGLSKFIDRSVAGSNIIDIEVSRQQQS